MTNTQFIRMAALKGGSIQLANKTVEYPNIDVVEVPDSTCWLCGGDTGGLGIAVKKGIKDTFTDHDLARDMRSNSLCQGCAFCLGQRPLRNYSVMVTDKLSHPGRAKLRDILLSPPEPPFLLAIAVSGQKHLTFKAHIAYNRDNFPVLLEEMMIFVSPEELRTVLKPVEMLYTEFSKAEIESGQYNHARIKKIGTTRWEVLENKISPHRGSRLFKLAIFIARREVISDAVPIEACNRTPTGGPETIF